MANSKPSVDGTVTANGNITAGGTLGVTGTSEFTGAVTSKGNLSVTNDGSGTVITGNLSVEGTSTLTGDVTASGALSVTGDTKLSGKLTASDGTAGTDGQILTVKSDGTIQWTDAPVELTVSQVDATGTVANTVGTLIINEPDSAADITMTLPVSTTLKDGHTLRIRRNFDYTGTNDSVTISKGTGGDTSDTINGQNDLKLNVGYQSVTLVYIGDGKWVSIN